MAILLSYPGRFFWTRQHGAYITMITSWVISIILLGFSSMQMPAIVFLLSSINVTELLAEQLTRKSRMPEYKLFWRNVYGVIALFAGIALMLFSPSFRQLLLILAGSAFIFTLLAINKKQKTLIAELLTFAFFVIAGFIGSSVYDWSEIIPVMLVSTIFFGTSVFSVKQRLDRINPQVVILCTLISILLTLWITQCSIFGIATSVLMFIKTSGAWAFRERYQNLKLKHIGMLELIFQIAYILIVVGCNL